MVGYTVAESWKYVGRKVGGKGVGEIYAGVATVLMGHFAPTERERGEKWKP